MNLQKLRNRVYDVIEDVKQNRDADPSILVALGRLAEIAEQLYEQAAMLDAELRRIEPPVTA